MANDYQSITLFGATRKGLSITLKDDVITITDNLGEKDFIVTEQHQADSIIKHFKYNWNELPDPKDEVIKELTRSLKAMTSSRNYYQSRADKKFRIYIGEHEKEKGRMKSLEIEREVYLQANETLKEFIRKKANDFAEIKSIIDNRNLMTDQKMRMLVRLMAQLR